MACNVGFDLTAPLTALSHVGTSSARQSRRHPGVRRELSSGAATSIVSAWCQLSADSGRAARRFVEESPRRGLGRRDLARGHFVGAFGAAILGRLVTADRRE